MNLTVERKPSAYELAHDAFATLLTQVNWQTFSTFTYARHIWSTEKVQKDLIKTIRNAIALSHGISRSNKRFKRDFLDVESPYAPWFIAIESHKSGSFHAHALTGSLSAESTGLDGTSLKTIHTSAIKTAFEECKDSGFTKIVPVRKNRSAVDYMIKTSRYITKDSNSVLDWNGLKGWGSATV
jgi:hypothetical protein